MPTQFIGFRNKEELKKHINKNFPKKKIMVIGKRKILKGITKSTPVATAYNVTFSKRGKR